MNNSKVVAIEKSIQYEKEVNTIMLLQFNRGVLLHSLTNKHFSVDKMLDCVSPNISNENLIE